MRGEVKALVQQLYAVKGRAEGGLNACIASAKAEYKSLPPEQQTRSRKIAICMSKAGQLSALQASCDSEVNRIVSQMRSVLKANGQSTALADQAMSSYKSQKSARRAALMSQLLRLSRFLITLWRNQRGTTHIFAARCGKRRFPALAGRCAPDAADHPNHFGSGRPETTYVDVCPEQIVLSKDAREVLSCGKPHSLKEWDAADAANPQLLPWEFWNAWSARTPAAQVYPVAACLFGALSGHLPMAAKARLNGAALRTPDRHPGCAEQRAPERPCSERSRPLAVAGGIPGGSGRCHQN